MKKVASSISDKELMVFSCNMDMVIITLIIGKVLEKNANIMNDISVNELQECFNYIINLF